jgi:hypothetical protein
MTIRAEQIMKAYEAEDTYNFPKDGVVAVIREVADRLCTDLGELECPIDKLREIADEIEAL